MRYIFQPSTDNIKTFKLHISGCQHPSFFPAIGMGIFILQVIEVVNVVKASLQIWSKREDAEGVGD